MRLTIRDRAVGRSENPGVPVLLCGHNLPPLVQIGLTDLPTETTGLTKDGHFEVLKMIEVAMKN